MLVTHDQLGMALLSSLFSPAPRCNHRKLGCSETPFLRVVNSFELKPAAKGTIMAAVGSLGCRFRLASGICLGQQGRRYSDKRNLLGTLTSLDA
jgi:hypothetical protein